jgi:hypothetical protein
MSVTTMTIARISGWGRKRPTAGHVPKRRVVRYLTSDSAAFTIVTIGRPDPEYLFT